MLSLVQKIKSGKSLGSLNIIVEISKVSPDQCSQLIAVLINATVKERKVHKEWNNSYIVSLFKGKSSALD